MDNKLKIDEINKEHFEYRDLKRRLNKNRNRLKALYKKYFFIDEVVNPKVDDIKLQGHVADLFKDLGYFAKRPKKTADFDVIIKTDKSTIGVEVKNDRHVGENELFQAKKYAGRHKADKDIILHPLIVWNNTKRNIDFDENRKKDALTNDYGIMTTSDLLKGYLAVKTGKLSFDIFHQRILKCGHIKFSGK